MNARDDLDVDPIDSQLATVGGDGGSGHWQSRRLALGLAASPMPVFALLLAGAAAGPQGLGLLTPRILQALDPAILAATVALGVLVGLDVDLFRRPGTRRMLAGSAAESGITLLAVGAAFLLASRQSSWAWPSLMLLSPLLGVCAAASGTAATGRRNEQVARRLGDLDDLLPIAVGAALFAYAAGDSARDRVALLGAAAALSVVIAIAGSLLVSDTAAEGEQRVHAMGVLLLLTGVAAYLSASPLFVGMLCGGSWNASQAAGRERLVRDFRHMQHPIVVLLLVVAGAQATLSPAIAGFAGLFAVVRLLAKMLGGVVAASVVKNVSRRLGLMLISPGVAAVAFALTVRHAAGLADTADALLGIVVWGAILSDLLALLVSWREEP